MHVGSCGLHRSRVSFGHPNISREEDRQPDSKAVLNEREEINLQTNTYGRDAIRLIRQTHPHEARDLEARSNKDFDGNVVFWSR